MSGANTLTTAPPIQARQRVIGIHDSGLPGPTLIAQGGIHGNEPGGVIAIERVLEHLRSQNIQIHGRLVGLVGNLRALDHGQRFVDRDLNRMWLAEAVAALRARDPEFDSAEDREQRELLEIYDRYTDRNEPVVFLDLHSSSAEGAPFSCMADTLPNRAIAGALPVPMILGLEECIDGAVMDYFNHRGQICVALEGGRHLEPKTADHLESGTWLAMIAAGLIDRDAIDRDFHYQRLDRGAEDLPPIVEIRHREVIRPDDGFQMMPGFVGFQRVKKGQVLAHNRHGPRVASERCRVLLPLYQGQGEDGYFLCRRIRPFWFWLSGALRKCRADRVLHWLPGVTKHPAAPHTLIANPSVARWLVVDVFHLLGFRHERSVDGKPTFSRRWSSAAAATVRPR